MLDPLQGTALYLPPASDFSVTCRAVQEDAIHRGIQRPLTRENPRDTPGVLNVAPTGIDPVTFRFSVERSTN